MHACVCTPVTKAANHTLTFRVLAKPRLLLWRWESVSQRLRGMSTNAHGERASWGTLLLEQRAVGIKLSITTSK